MTDSTSRDGDLEELVLKESIVSATGLAAGRVAVGIKGDPSLRETALYRTKYPTVLDERYEEVRPNLEEMLLNRGTFRLYLGFNSAEVRTVSIFDPLREETHAAEKLTDRDYIDRHFPAVPFEEKVAAMRGLSEYLLASPLFSHVPEHWRRIFSRRHLTWQPMEKDEVLGILSTLKVLRDMPDYYLRSASVCLVQDLVRMNFNCDGTQLTSAENYKRFLEENLP